MLADSHVHLDRYSAGEVSSMLRRARRAGVSRFLAVGVDLPSSRAACALARRRGVLAAVGIHPTRLHGRPVEATLAALSDLANRLAPSAIGEVGLDRQASAPVEDQARFLAGCLDLAAHRGLPLVLHVVGEHAAALRVLADAERLPAGVVHYFIGDRALAERYLDLGLHISVGKPAVRLEHPRLREAIATIPLDRLLLETDTYPMHGRFTEPYDVTYVCAAVARIKGVTFDEVATRTTENFDRLFSPSTPRRA